LFFILSKTFGALLLPTNFLIGVGLVGAILLVTRFASLGRKLVMISVLLLVVCGLSPLGNLLLYPLERRFPPWDAGRGAPDGIIVLGASIEADLSAAHGSPVVRSAPDRIIAAAALAHRYPNARIVFSGGSANLISNDAREADFAGAVFESLKSIDGPKTMLLITEGMPDDEGMGALRDLASRAAAARVSLYVLRLDAGGIFADMERARPNQKAFEDADLRRRGMDALASMARGAVFNVVGGAEDVYDRIARELTGYYLLGFEPQAGDRDGHDRGQARQDQHRHRYVRLSTTIGVGHSE
jgi:hypothetical protein